MANVFAVARVGKDVYVRAQGLANMKNAPLLDAFLRAEMADGANQVLVDLSSCAGMDSTFMGLLVGKNDQLREHGGDLRVLNANAQCDRLLRMLGIDMVVDLIGGLELPDMEFVPLQSDPSQTRAQQLELVQQAHEALVALSEENRRKFEPFLEAMQKDISRRSGGQD